MVESGREAQGAERATGARTGIAHDGAALGRAEYRVESLAKGLRILSLFSEAQPALRLNDIAERAGLPVSTAFRLVTTLERERYVEKLPNGLFRPSTAVLTLGFAALSGLDLVQTSAIPLRQLAALTGQTINLGVLTGDQVLYLVRLRNTDLVTASLQVGSVLPAVYASMGKLLLAYLESEKLKTLLGSASFSGEWGPKAVHSVEDLRRQLDEIRTQGWAIQDEEIAHGLRSIAGPVRDASGRVVAAVNIAVQAAPWPVERILAELREPVLAACAEISQRLGSPGTRPGGG